MEIDKQKVKITFIAGGSNTWGRGDTVKAAKAQRIKSGGSGKCRVCLVVWIPHEETKDTEGPYISDMGDVEVPGVVIASTSNALE